MTSLQDGLKRMAAPCGHPIPLRNISKGYVLILFSFMPDKLTYLQLVRTSKLTGNAECPSEIEWAHRIEHLISNRVASGIVRDDDLNDEIIEISSASDMKPTV